MGFIVLVSRRYGTIPWFITNHARLWSVFHRGVSARRGSGSLELHYAKLMITNPRTTAGSSATFQTRTATNTA